MSFFAQAIGCDTKRKKQNGRKVDGPAEPGPTNYSRAALREIYLQVSNPRKKITKNGVRIAAAQAAGEKRLK